VAAVLLRDRRPGQRTMTDRLKDGGSPVGTPALGERCQVLEAVLRHTHVLAVYLDPQFNFVWVNRAYADACRREPGFFPGKNHFDLYPGADNQQIFRRVVDTARPFFVEAKPFVFPDQPERGVTYWDWSLIPDETADGKVVGLVFTLADATNRARTEAALRASQDALRESERRLSELAAQGRVIVWEVDALGLYTYLSPVVEQVLGYRPEEIVGRQHFYDLHPEAGREEFKALAFASFARKEGFANLENPVVTRDGRILWVNTNGLPLLHPDGTLLGYRGSDTDITEHMRMGKERERLREELLQAQKLEAIGTLAGGVAHDFNNILGGVLSGLSLLAASLREDDERRADIRDMTALVQRGADLTRQLLGFARRGKYEVEPLDLARIVGSTSTMFGSTRRDVTIHHELAPDLRRVLMNHAQLEQVLLNIFLNAGQAMPGGGRLILRAENVELAAEPARAQDLAPGRFVRLDITDTGVGMDPATQARIFEPFFTTKAAGQGSGLGLASVYGIVKNHGGAVTVESAPGKGTTFTLLLPATDAPAPAPPAPAAAPHHGAGIVLVVDDEERIRRGCARMLRLMGYDVLSAAGGREALELARAHRDRLVLVILDLTMPEMSGAATYAALREMAPDLKVLLSSGYTVEGEAGELLARGCNGFIQKPFDLDALAAKLEEIL
jgi:two-component system, cell cycle sensor histidine kinase and response regulator CckA